jgi:5-methylcytosine-specific restriction endonuclease McrA
MSLTVITNDGEKYMNVKEVGAQVFGGCSGFINDLKDYSRKHKLNSIVYNDEDWLTCRKLGKITAWMQRQNPSLDTKDFKAFLRKHGGYLNTRRFNQTHRIHVMYTQGYRCGGCEQMLKPDCELDHVKPLEEGGSDTLMNLQALCVACHSAKTYDARVQKHPMFKDASIHPDTSPINVSKYFEQYMYRDKKRRKKFITE